MIMAYLVMVAMITLSILFLYGSVLKRLRSLKKLDSQAFGTVRRREIAEELEAGRLTSNESVQLLLDVDHESERQASNRKHTLHIGIPLARWVMLGVVVVLVLGSVSLYQRMGYAKEVLFTQDLQTQDLTPQKVSDFLQYRSRRYGSVEDWYYEATDDVSAGRYNEAVVAFEKALEAMPREADGRVNLLVEYAQAIFYANGNQSSVKMQKTVDAILEQAPTEAIALGLKGVAEFDQKNYLGAVLAWQEAIRYNSNSAERIALLSAITKARDVGAIDYQQVAPIITHQLAMKVEWDKRNLHWLKDDILLVYALAKGQKMPVAIQRVFPEDLEQPILLTNLDAVMPTVTLAQIDKVDIVVKLSNINDNDLTKGRIIGIKHGLLTNTKEIFVINVAL
ncbi:c-type cytochrome biogenesis protein CcmI/CycH [Marinomonas primoryensis]|uniref:tetratricopeptide repeat protein n=1 Tax=Marinomonas primoryensis TaxID=178399 RepID=UPI0030DD88C8